MLKFKEQPEDFIVEEVINFKKTKGDYNYYTLEKKNYNTLDAISEIADELKINRNRINFAGLKDRNAITKQYISIYKYQIKELNLKDIKLKFIATSDKPVSPHNIKENKFIIVIRNVKNKKKVKIKSIENYFDEQRFSKNNAEIGKLITKKDYKRAEILLEQPLETIDKRLIKFYVNSYQSYLFNLVLDQYKKSEKIPLLNFDTKFKDKKIKEIYERIMREEGISQNDFINKRFPFIVSETVYRPSIIKVKNFKLKYEGSNAILSFSLPPSSYATLVIKKYINLVE